MKRRLKSTQILQVRADVYINTDQIDTIVYTDKDPKDNQTKLEKKYYVMYLKKNSKYNWIMLSEEEFNTYVKNNI